MVIFIIILPNASYSHLQVIDFKGFAIVKFCKVQKVINLPVFEPILCMNIPHTQMRAQAEKVAKAEKRAQA